MLHALRNIFHIRSKGYNLARQNQQSIMKDCHEPTSQVNYTISRVPSITPQNRAGLNRMIDIYAASDPHITAFKVNQGRTMSQVLKNFLLGPIDQGMSFVAIDNDSNEIIGLIINHMNTGCSGMDDLPNLVKDDCEKELVRFWETLGSEPKSLANEVVYNIEYNIVDPRYRKSGIALALGKKALQLGHERGVKFVRSECSNAYTSLIAEQMEYTREYSVAYEDVLDSKGNKVFTNVQPPHTHLHIYILYMDKAVKRPYLETTS